MAKGTQYVLKLSYNVVTMIIVNQNNLPKLILENVFLKIIFSVKGDTKLYIYEIQTWISLRAIFKDFIKN